MIISSELNLKDFPFWSGGKDAVKYFTYAEMNQIEEILEDLYPDGMTDTKLNDLFWFDTDTICEWIGIEPSELYNRDVF